MQKTDNMSRLPEADDVARLGTAEEVSSPALISWLRGSIDTLPPGSQLPSVRELMRRHKVGPGTVGAAFAQLAAEGRVVTLPGRGTFVARPLSAPSRGDTGWQLTALGERLGAVDELEETAVAPAADPVPLLSAYLPTDLQPLADLRRGMHRAIRREDAWERVPAEGIAELRAWFSRQIGGDLTEFETLIAPGAQAALSSVIRALSSPGDALVVESPTFVNVLALARALKLRLVPVPTDAGGVRVEPFLHALETSRAKLIYLQPTIANPHGATLAGERRRRVLSGAAAAGAFIIEDDFARDLVFSGPAAPPLARDDPDGHVIYVRSLTKVIAPSMRVCAICARGGAFERLRATRLLDDLFVSAPLQQTALELLTSPAWPKHLRRVCRALELRRDAMVDAIDEFLPGIELPFLPRGGLHLWVRLPNQIDEGQLVQRAQHTGVIVSRGRNWFPADAPGPHLRLTYAATGPESIREGVRRLAAAIGSESAESRETKRPLDRSSRISSD
jgi:DNA-binding transcriptional MocR family regulator